MNNIFSIKWRPKKFSEIVGHNNIIYSIINSFKNYRISNSYIIYGSYGVGKTTIARLIAKGLNCNLFINKNLNNINYNFPCNICNNCILVENNNFIDFIEIDAAIKTKIDDIRDLLNNINYVSYYGYKKIYLIDEVHTLSKQSLSALLKSLEEPPKNVIFILTTTDISKIPDTILSRCFKINLSKISNKVIINKLINISKYENINFEIESLYYISEISNGSLRDSLNILEQLSIYSNNNIKLNDVVNLLNICSIDELINIVEYIIFNDFRKLYSKLYYIFRSNFDYKFIIDKLISIIHYIFMINFNENYYLDILFYNKKNKLVNLSKNLSLKKIDIFSNLLVEFKEKLIYYSNYKLLFEIYILKIFSNINNLY